MSRYIDKKNGEQRRRKAYNYLVEKGLKPHQAAGVLGNLMQESYAHLDSTVENKIGAVGIAQWLGERKKSLLEFAKNKGTAHTDFDTQLDFLWNELNTTGNSWNRTADKDAFFNSQTAAEAADIFVRKFERSGENPGDEGYDNRLKNAKKVFLQFNDKEIYGKDASGRIVNLNPETATAEQRALSPRIRSEFYNQNFDMISEQDSKTEKEPNKAVIEAEKAIEAKQKEKQQREEFIKELNTRNEEPQNEVAEAAQPQAEEFDPYAMDITTPDNEFFANFIPEGMQEGGRAPKKPSNLTNSGREMPVRSATATDSLRYRNLVNAKAPRVGVRDNGDGNESSHIMGQMDNFAYPKLFQNEDKTWLEIEDDNKAFDEAERRGELFELKDEQDAMWFAEGAWKPKVKQDGGPAKGETKDLKYDKFLFDTEGGKYEQQRIVDYKKKFGQINNVANGSCVAGALNCNTDLIAPQLGVKPVRAMLEEVEGNLGKYKIPSQNYLDGKLGSNNYIQNNSIDAWEAHQTMRGEGIGSDFFTADENTKYKGSLPEGMDYSSIPIGSIIGQGNSKGFYTEDKYGDRNRHGMTVSGYDKDGMPMMYDSGKFVRLDKLGSLGDEHKITHITVPKGYEGYDFKKISTEVNKKQKELGLDKFEPVKFQSSKPTFKAMEGAINEVKNVIAKDYSVPQSTINKLAGAIPGMGFQETKLDSTEGISKSIILDTAYGNASGKMHAKTIDNMATAVGNIFRSSDQPRRQDYKMEIEAYKKFPKDEAKRNAEFKRLAEINEGYDKPYRTEIDQSSKGPFAIKDYPEYAETRLGVKPGDMYGMTTSSETELANGSKVALTYLAENYNKLKKKHKDLTEDQLVNLTLVSYNNKEKSEDPEFIKYYIKGDKLRDDYLDKVRNYKPDN